MKRSHCSNTYGATVIGDQVVAGYVQQNLEQKAAEMRAAVNEILKNEVADKQLIHEQFNHAMQHVERLRDFVAPDNHGHILGANFSKHGEIAEHIQVEITNARNIMGVVKDTANIDTVGRTAAEDYIINGIPVQSKFIANANESLKHVLGHLDKYPDFANDAANYGYPGKSGYYHIPKDQFEVIRNILDGKTEGVSTRILNSIKNSVENIEAHTGKDFYDVVKPSISNYREVQLGVVDRTIDGYETEFKDITKEGVSRIEHKYSMEAEKASHIADPSLREAINTGLIGCIVGGGISGGFKVYKKLKSGKKITQFSLNDWKEVGIDFSKGAVRGGISGVAIYGLTRIGNFAAPFAGAMVSSAMAALPLYLKYKNGIISSQEYSCSVCAMSVEAGFAAVGAAIGQAIIPIPVVGALVGSCTSKAALALTGYITGKKEAALINYMNKEYERQIAILTQQQKIIIAEVDAWYSGLDGLIEASLNPDVEKAFQASIEFCRYVNVPENQIIHNLSELDDFMLS